MDNHAFRFIFESSPEPMWIFEEDTLRFLHVNQAATKVYGYTKEEFLGMTIADIRPQEDVAALIESIRPTGEFGDKVWRHLSKSGVDIEVLIFSTPTTYGGRPARAVMVRDVTAQNRSRRELADAKAALDAILAASPACIISVDTLGRIATCNPATERLLGIQLSEAVGMTVSDAFGIDPLAFSELLAEVFAGDTVDGIHLSVSRAGGDERHLMLSAAPLLGERGESSGAMAIFLNVTESVLAHRDLEAWSELLERRVAERTSELVAANEELEGFCASVSHDLRGPLRAIDGFSKVLIEDYGPQLDEFARDYLDRVRAAAWKMSDLIDDLLGLARLTRAPLQRRKIDIALLAREVAPIVSNSYPGHKVEFICPPSLSAYGDLHQLRRLIEALLDNAWKFTSKIDHAIVEIGVDEFDDQTIYWVSDNGAGFDMTFVSKLFKPFERLHRATDFPGNGIGLATAHRIVTRHGGRIWAEGAPDEGTTIRFTLDSLATGDQNAHRP